MKMSEFIESTDVPESIVRAVVRALGGWKEFEATAPAVDGHGADAGFAGFTYYSDTVAFFRKHRAALLEMLKADEFDTMGANDVAAFVSSFRCMADVSADAIAETLYGRWKDSEWSTTVANGIAWYALGAVCREYVNIAD